MLLAATREAAGGRHGSGVVLAAATRWQFGVNALFHLITAVAFLDDSPGMVTAASLGLPATAVFFGRTWREGWLTGAQPAGALAVGTALPALAIGALFL